ncbi:unnamed protein product [Rotaria magnacalcarata]|uniref:Integrase catalytic domain-containing protein n=2 Tax=Rotaria magnacalcarata TaxID=392030 RepID=A0A816RVS2_9BILA|nr:unnamed protein product [Rotaria magnacalcarata]
MVKQSTKKLFYDYEYPRNEIREITCFKCTFKTRQKDKRLAHLNKLHHPVFEELKEELRNNNKVLNGALKNVSDDDKDDDDDEHEHLTSDNRTLSHVTTAPGRRKRSVDLIDMRSVQYNGFNFIMHVKDHFKKFSWLFSLPTKEARHVALNLKNIFYTFGSPKILQSDNGKEFV